MPWPSLESIAGLVATETEWRRLLGQTFPAFNALCLEDSTYQVASVRCPRHCGCNHRVIPRHDGLGAVGVCRCGPRACPDIALQPPDITALRVSETRLGAALCRAFGFKPRYARLPALNSFQFGSWSTDSVPAILTIQVQNSAFRRAVAELAAQLPQPFILFAPTADFMDAPARIILASHRAGFFALNNHVILTDHGTLQPTCAPGELFARFTPQPREMDMDVATRAFALVRKLDTEKPLSPPSLLTVFRLYCIEELSTVQIAHKCKRDKSIVVRRLDAIRKRIGMEPSALRQFSTYISKLEDSLRDPRAPRIRPQSHIDEDTNSPGET